MKITGVLVRVSLPLNALGSSQPSDIHVCRSPDNNNNNNNNGGRGGNNNNNNNNNGGNGGANNNNNNNNGGNGGANNNNNNNNGGNGGSAFFLSLFLSLPQTACLSLVVDSWSSACCMSSLAPFCGFS